MTFDDQPLIDRSVFDELLGALPSDVRRRIVEVAARDLVTLSATIRDAASEKEASDARHQLLGAAGGVGAVAVHRLATARGAEQQLIAAAHATAQQLLDQ